LEQFDTGHQEHSTEHRARVLTERKLEPVCEASRLKETIALIVDNAQTDQTNSGYIYVSSV
jgi:nitrogen regulatory protein PII